MENLTIGQKISNGFKEFVASIVELFVPTKAKWKGIPNYIFFAMFVITTVLLYLPDEDGVAGGYIRNTFIVTLGVLAVFGIFFGEIGNRIPIWKTYVGGGTILVFFMASIFNTYGLIPETVAANVDVFYNDNPIRFLEIFIPALIVGSILTVNRKTLLRSVGGYIPLILIGVAGAMLAGIGVGLIFGISPSEIAMKYVLPIMGGGTGAGALPMSEMWETATGEDPQEWLSFALSILTIANIFAIFTGAMLNAIGKKKPSLTGNGDLIKNNKVDVTATEKEEWETIDATPQDFAASLFMTGILFLFAHFLAEMWSMYVFPILPENAQFELHRLAILVILVIILNVAKLVPPRVKAGAKAMQDFFVKNTLWILMAAVGMSTKFDEIVNAFTLSNAAIALSIVLGAVAAIMFVSRVFKFYPIEAAITAGLCMANRGGSGDVAVLGAADRMNLISFAQISSRIGGAMMLIIASIVFALFG